MKEFKAILGEYIARSKGVEVQMRLVQEREKEAKDLPMTGFVNLLDSNSEDFALDAHDIGREATVHNAVGRVNKEGAVEDRGVSGDKNSGVYYGRTDAKDGFAGYAQIRYSYDGGPVSGWETVEDLDLAKDIVMTLVGRKYSAMDERVVPSEKVMEMLLKAEAMDRLVLNGTVLEKGLSKRPERKEDSKVIELPQPKAVPAAEVPSGAVAAPEVPEESGSVEGLGGQPVAGPIEYTRSAGGYQQRTAENANAEDVDFTFAFGVDFTTYGERATAKAAGDSIVQVTIPVKKDGGIDLSAKAVAECVRAFEAALPEEFFKGESCGVNIAGNGIYTLSAKGISQEDADRFVTKVMDGLRRKGMAFSSLRSGGQSGIDEAGAVAGVVLGIPTTVHGTKDWRFRGVDNRDVCDENLFKARFETKHYQALRESLTPSRKKVNQQTV